jgi:hypothetical protein
MPLPENALMISSYADREKFHKFLSEMLITVTDQMFQGREIFVDGYRFINCSFIDCKLTMLRGTFEFHHCLLRGSRREWNEDALKCIQLYAMGNPALQDNGNPGFAAKMHPDGTFSVGKGATIP